MADRLPERTPDPAQDRGRHPAKSGDVHRPILERLGLLAIALVFAALFGGMALAAWVGGELFLAVLAAGGAVMTVWVGLVSLVKS